MAKTKKSSPNTAAKEVNPVDDFIGFLKQYAIIGLSIGFIIGNQMSSFVKVIVSSLIAPLLSLVFGLSLSQQTLKISFHGRHASFEWGAVVYNLIELAILLIILYLVIKLSGLSRLEKPKR
jgi:large conductance mechanosensitive channel